MVGVKGLARDIALAGYRLLVRDIIDLRIPRHVHLTLVVLEQLAEDLRGGDELRWREALVADHQYVMLGKGAVQRSAGRGVDHLVQVDATHFGAGVRGQRGDRVLHRANTRIQWKVRPPSTASAAPVTNDDSVAVRNRMAWAISSGSAMRFSAYRSKSRCRPEVIGVSTIPGQTLLTRMSGANSAASARVRFTTPPFEAA